MNYQQQLLINLRSKILILQQIYTQKSIFYLNPQQLLIA